MTRPSVEGERLPLPRRQALKLAGAGGMWALGGVAGRAWAQSVAAVAPAAPAAAGPHVLPPLPFAENALAPYMSAQTLGFHHGKHHKAYVDNLNRLVAGTPLAELPLDKLVVTVAGKPEQQALFNNAAQVWNHTFFWNCMKPAGGGEPGGALAAAINAKWGSYAAFKEAFTKSAVGNFGSGWTWLVKKADGSVDIVNMGAAGTPLTTADKALLTVDVWEHAYYIDYRNLRPKFVETFLDKLVNWDYANAKYKGQEAGVEK